MVNETTVDNYVRELDPAEWHLLTWTSVLNAVLALADVVLMFQANRRIVDAYMAAIYRLRRDSIRQTYAKIRELAIRLSVVSFIFAGVYGSAALCGMTFRSFWAVDRWFAILEVTSLLFSLFVLNLSMQHFRNHCRYL